MVNPVYLEEAILNVIIGVSLDNWVQFTMGSLRNRLNEFDVALVNTSDGEIIDCICSLEKESLIVTRKSDGGNNSPFARAQAEEDRYRHQFFWIGSFELKITHEGRKVVAQKRVPLKQVIKIESSADEMDDRLPLYRPKVLDADIERFVKEAMESGFPLALVMIDVDKFKQVNDTHGHLTGDDVLLAISTTIAKRAHGKGKAYRYGRGDEMAILLPNYSKMEASTLAETIRIQLEQSQMTDKKVVVTASFGVAAVPEDSRSAKELLKLADDALLVAKQLGRNLVRAVGDVNEVKESGVPKRKQATTRQGWTERQLEAIRVLYFNRKDPKCPTDGTPLRVEEVQEVVVTTPTLHVSCPICGTQEYLPGV
jgi:diguanylate cyclase (GGDEF)-like protein